MKKSSLLVLALALGTFSGLTACSPKPHSVSLNYGQCLDEELKVIHHSELNSMVNEKKNFLLVVIPEDEHCGCWQNFKRICLEPVIKERHLIIYAIRAGQFRDTEENELPRFGLNVINDRETIAGFLDGRLFVQAEYDRTNPMFWNYETFKKWLDKYFTMPTMYYISLEQLDLLYAQKDTDFTIVYGYDSCIDCTYVYRTLFKEYSNNNRNAKPFFLIDADRLRPEKVIEGKTVVDEETSFIPFKKERGLTDQDPKFGYTDVGKVPTLFQIHAKGKDADGKIIYTGDDVIKSGAVVFNDTIKKIDDKYILTESYYSEERKQYLKYLENVPEGTETVLQGREIPKEEIITYPVNGHEYYVWRQECSEKCYRPLLNAFLDDALPKTSDKVFDIICPAK